MKPTNWLPTLTALAVAAPGALAWGAVGELIISFHEWRTDEI